MSMPRPKFWQICTRFTRKITAANSAIRPISPLILDAPDLKNFTFVRFFEKIYFSFKKRPRFQGRTNRFLLFS